MQMTREKALVLGLICLYFLMCGPQPALADVAPGDVIDKSNWEKVQGMVPDNVLNWLKQGDLKMEVVDLNYDPEDYNPPVAKKSLETNKGKYDVDEKGLMVEVATGKLPKFIEGMPFPDIDLDDPKAATKVAYNKYYNTYSLGHTKYPFSVRWVGRNTGVEREVNCDYRVYPMDGAPAARDEKNPKNLERMSLILVLAPFDIRGTNILNWRFRHGQPDSTFSYIPAIRRVRRMSPANRSDSFIGSDICVDDAWGFDGKVNSMEWKLLRRQEALLPFLQTDPVPFEITQERAWKSSKGHKVPIYGYEDKNRQGAPWMPTNLVWAKRPAYVIQVTPKDPYYNYGAQYLWIDAEVLTITTWKIIHDRAGKYWKTMWLSYAGYQGPEDEQKAFVGATQIAIDDRTDHASVILLADDEHQMTYNDTFDRNDFSLAGFQKFCK
jgi:hypothetical protein